MLTTISVSARWACMGRDALWLVLVMMWCRLLVLLVPDDEPVSVNEDEPADENAEEGVLGRNGKVLNALLRTDMIVSLSPFHVPHAPCSGVVGEQRDRRRFYHCHSW